MLRRALLCAACALLVSATPAHATFPGHNGKIVFASFVGVDDDAVSDTDEEAPDWSPDGKRISFHWNAAPPGEDWDVYVMRRHGGSRPIRLTTTGAYNPAWSPDGRKVVFNTDQLFIMRADGSGPRPVLPEFLDGHHPDWQTVPKNARAEDDD